MTVASISLSKNGPLEFNGESAIILGDCFDGLHRMGEAGMQVDAIVTDPPYGISFMGSGWDRFHASRESETGVEKAEGSSTRMTTAAENRAFRKWTQEWAQLAFQVLKPGGYAAVFGASKMFGHVQVALEEAGFEVRDTLMWLYGMAMPKSMSVDKAIDKHLGAKRRVIGKAAWSQPAKSGHHAGMSGQHIVGAGERFVPDVTAPATAEAAQWEGWGTALKPGYEPILLVRKPLIGTVAENVLTHGTGAIHIGACRTRIQSKSGLQDNWPTNVLHDGSGRVLAAFEEFAKKAGSPARYFPTCPYDTEDALRFHYSGKASPTDRNEGLSQLSGDIGKNSHPTVKPTALMRWLCRLITPPGGLILDPFMGSGSTGKAAALEGYRFIGIEREAMYFEIARNRIAYAATQVLPEAA